MLRCGIACDNRGVAREDFPGCGVGLLLKDLALFQERSGELVLCAEGMAESRACSWE